MSWNRGPVVRDSTIRASDLPAIAKALGIEVKEVIETAKRVESRATRESGINPAKSHRCPPECGCGRHKRAAR